MIARVHSTRKRREQNGTVNACTNEESRSNTSPPTFLNFFNNVRLILLDKRLEQFLRGSSFAVSCSQRLTGKCNRITQLSPFVFLSEGLFVVRSWTDLPVSCRGSSRKLFSFPGALNPQCSLASPFDPASRPNEISTRYPYKSLWITGVDQRKTMWLPLRRTSTRARKVRTIYVTFRSMSIEILPTASVGTSP